VAKLKQQIVESLLNTIALSTNLIKFYLNLTQLQMLQRGISWADISEDADSLPELPQQLTKAVSYSHGTDNASAGAHSAILPPLNYSTEQPQQQQKPQQKSLAGPINFAGLFQQKSSADNNINVHTASTTQTIINASKTVKIQANPAVQAKPTAKSWSDLTNKLAGRTNNEAKANPADRMEDNDLTGVSKRLNYSSDEEELPSFMVNNNESRIHAEYDLELDSSRHGLPLLFQSILVKSQQSAAEAIEEEKYNENNNSVAGIKRKEQSEGNYSDADINKNLELLSKSEKMSDELKSATAHKKNSPPKPNPKKQKLEEEDKEKRTAEAATPAVNRVVSSQLSFAAILAAQTPQQNKTKPNLSPPNHVELDSTMQSESNQVASTSSPQAQLTKQSSSVQSGISYKAMLTGSVETKVEASLIEPSEPTKAKIPPPAKQSVEHRKIQRQKQIDLGKRSAGYKSYSIQIPKESRILGQHLNTPNLNKDCSKRQWDGFVKSWRRFLHKFDPNPADDEESSIQSNEDNRSEVSSNNGN
jgi:hypothetical protein